MEDRLDRMEAFLKKVHLHQFDSVWYSNVLSIHSFIQTPTFLPNLALRLFVTPGSQKRTRIRPLAHTRFLFPSLSLFRPQPFRHILSRTLHCLLNIVCQLASLVVCGGEHLARPIKGHNKRPTLTLILHQTFILRLTLMTMASNPA